MFDSRNPDVLYGEASETKDAIVTGYLLGSGGYEGIPCEFFSGAWLVVPLLMCLSDTRFWEITQLVLNPPAPAPVEEEEAVPEAIEETVGSTIQPPLGLSTTGSFDFMQSSDMTPPARLSLSAY